MSRRKDRLRRQGRVMGPLCDFVRGRKCLVCGRPGEPHHVRPRGHGGSREDWLPIVVRDGRIIEYKGIVGNIAPLCHDHHIILHGPNGGVETFAQRYRISLPIEAVRIGREFEAASPYAFEHLDEIYALVALRKPELCFPETRKSA